jgi:hypothetical protein
MQLYLTDRAVYMANTGKVLPMKDYELHDKKPIEKPSNNTLQLMKTINSLKWGDA